MALANSSSRPQAITALRQIARALSAAWDLDSTLDLIASKTTEVMQVDSCSIYLLDPDGDTLRLQASTGLSKQAVGRATLKTGQGMTGYAVQQNQPIYALDAPQHPAFKLVDEADETPFASLLAVPLSIETSLIGAMNVQTKRPYAFTANDIETVSLIGDLAAGALAKARLYDQQRRQLADMHALAQVSEAATSPQYLDDLLEVVMKMAAQVMNTAVCSLFLLDEHGRHLELRAVQRNNSAYADRPPLPIGNSAVGHVARTGKPLYIADVRHDPRYKGQTVAQNEGLVSLLAVPLIVREQVIGVLNAYTTVPHTFSEEQYTWFATLANQTALAIENARLVTNTAVIREMHHRIKNNLQTVAMLMQLQLPDADQLDTRDVLNANIHRIRSIAAVHEMLSDKGFRLVDIKTVLERISQSTIEAIAPSAQAIHIHIFGESLALPSRPATALILVVNELMQNALEHAFNGRDQGQIDVSLGRSSHELIVIVSDNGVGMHQTSKRGLGLELATTLVSEDLHGHITFLPSANGGTEVSIRIPRQIEQELGS